MAKAKTKTAETEVKDVLEEKSTPVTEPVASKVDTSSATPPVQQEPATQVQPTTAVVEKKSGGGWMKWCVCCLVVLLLCCVCTIGSSYLLITRTGDIIKAITTSTRNEALTRITPADVVSFDSEQYFIDHPNTDLGNNKFEMIIPEEIVLKLLFGSPENSFLLNYVGIDIQEDIIKLQFDIGGLMSDQSYSQSALGQSQVPFINIESLKGIYINVDITTTGDKNFVIQSLRIGESPLDFGSLASTYMQSVISDLESQEFFQAVEKLEFHDGYVRILMSGEAI